MVLMVVNTVIFGLAAELFILGTILSFNNIIVINEHTAPLLVCGVFAILNFPVVVKLREYGVENLNFVLHESAMNSLMTPHESWSNVILAFLDETGLRSHELTMLVRLIDEAPGPLERQARRAEAKAWLKENRDKLTDEDRQFVNDYLGYLH
jgi:hypothetical protein